MRPDFLDRYSRLDSPIHRLPAATKLLTALALVVAIIAIAPWHTGFFLVVAGLLVTTMLLARLPPLFIARRLLMLEPIPVAGAALTLLQPDGWAIFLSIVLKSTLCLYTMVLLSSTTPFDAILFVLRRARLPALLITTLALMYRYLYVLMDESRRMRRARQSRSFGIPPPVKGGARGRCWGTRAWYYVILRTWKSPAAVAARLFVRSGERAERIYAAMCARGWK